LKLFKLALLSSVLSLPLHAQTKPVIRSNGVVNAASYSAPGLPGSTIAQGSIFIVFGSGLGPAALAQSSGFPVPTTFSGTSLSVTVGATIVQPYILYVSGGQLAAVMPSSTPVGTASLVVTYNGQTSAPALFQVTANSFGIFSQNSAGSGPGIVTNASVKVNGIDTLVTNTTAMKPGDVGIIWGTGLGPVAGDESAGALPGDMPQTPVEVYVGGAPATLAYRGRSGCCSGLDQIAFVVPDKVEGCNVPVAVKIGTAVSNYTSIAVNSTGTACNDLTGLSSADQKRLAGVGNVSIGSLTLTRSNISIPVPILGTISNVSDIGAGLFEKFNYAQYSVFQNPTNFSIPGACTVFSYTGTTATYIDPQQPTILDAGDLLTVTGPNGVKTLVKGSATGLQYSRTLGNVTTGSSGGSPLYLDKGSYTIVGSGGPGVGAFSAAITLPDPLVWSNQAATDTVTRASGQTVTWTGGDPSGSVLILGFSTVAGAQAGREFLCVEKASAATFTIPAAVLLAVPATVGSPSGTTAASVTGALGVGYEKSNSFTAPGIDQGTIVGLGLNLKIVSYK
jgi:uncharacterized protein (TIGR03437 family)